VTGSLKAKRTRLAKVDDKLIVSMFGWSTRGFAAPEDRSVAVCLLPGTELSFAEEVRKVHSWPWSPPTIRHKTAIFRKVHERNPTVHHDALEFPDGRIILVTFLELGQQATVLQLVRRGKEKVPTEIGTFRIGSRIADLTLKHQSAQSQAWSLS
jgi:hypothetical protein